jgi:hypothetical protein
MTAQILTHARFAIQPVAQHPRRGRFPKAVPNLLIYARDKNLKAFRNAAADARVNELRRIISEEEGFFTHLRRELAMAVQLSNVGRI